MSITGQLSARTEPGKAPAKNEPACSEEGDYAYEEDADTKEDLACCTERFSDCARHRWRGAAGARRREVEDADVVELLQCECGVGQCCHCHAGNVGGCDGSWRGWGGELVDCVDVAEEGDSKGNVGGRLSRAEHGGYLDRSEAA